MVKMGEFYKKAGILFIVVAFFMGNAAAYEPRNLLQKIGNEDFVKNVLLPKEKWVTYPSYNDRSGWNLFLGDNQNAVIESGEKLLDYQWQVVTATDYLEFSRSGSRAVMEDPYKKNLAVISSLFLAEMAEGKGRFMDQLINGVFAACEMTTWSLSAHLSIQLNNKKFPDHNQHIIDLAAGDVGATFSWIYYLLHTEFDKKDKLIAQRLKYEIKRRILEPYMNVNHFWWMGFELKPSQVVNNWNVWCNSNVLQAFALMEEDKDKLAKAVFKTMRSVDQFINYIKEDGACEEGPSYWQHAAGKLYDYLQILSDITGEKISIFNEPIVKNAGEYISRSYIGKGWVVNFADASAKTGGDAPLIYRFGKAVGSKEMESFAAYLVQNNYDNLRIMNSRDMYRVLQSIAHNKEITTIQPALPLEQYTWYPQTEFCYMKNNSFFFAAKGGFNNESHNHNDVGTFSLYVDSIPFFIDAGVGTYTRQTFSSERYSIWTMQSNFHNLPQVNGLPQSFGAKFKATNVSFNAKQNRFSLNIGDAYAKEAAVKLWQRTYTLADNGLNIEDEFELTTLKEPSKINFLTWAQPVITKPGTVLLTKNHTSVLFSYNPQLFNVVVETIPQDDKRLSNVWGKEIYRLTLMVKQPALKGKYAYSVKKVN